MAMNLERLKNWQDLVKISDSSKPDIIGIIITDFKTMNDEEKLDCVWYLLGSIHGLRKQLEVNAYQ